MKPRHAVEVCASEASLAALQFVATFAADVLQVTDEQTLSGALRRIRAWASANTMKSQPGISPEGENT